MRQIPEELVLELKEILREEYNVELTDSAVAQLASLLVSYVGILQKALEDSHD